MLTEEQHQIRSTGLGSSDVAAVVGESPYKTCHDVYCEKRGLIEPFSGNDATWLGNVLEPHAAERYTEETGVPLTPGPGTVRHPDHDWIVASTDFETVDGSRIVECKFVGGRVAHHWSKDEEGVPAYVMTQCQWQMLTRGIWRCDVAVIFGATAEFRIYELAYDDVVGDLLVDVAGKFWRDNILAGNPPDVDHTENARQMLLALYSRDKAPLMPSTPEATSWVERRLAAEPELDKWQKEYDLANNKIRQAIGEAAGIEGYWGKATWKANARGVRTLRVYPRKEKAA